MGAFLTLVFTRPHCHLLRWQSVGSRNTIILRLQVFQSLRNKLSRSITYFILALQAKEFLYSRKIKSKEISFDHSQHKITIKRTNCILKKKLMWKSKGRETKSLVDFMGAYHSFVRTSHSSRREFHY